MPCLLLIFSQSKSISSSVKAKPLPVAHFHDFGLEVAQGSVGTAVLATGFRVGWPVHVGQERDFLYPQAVNDDMHMDIAAVVMPVRVGTYKGLVAGESLYRQVPEVVQKARLQFQPR